MSCWHEIVAQTPGLDGWRESLAELAGTNCTAQDVDRMLVAPLAADGFTAIDWNICSTGIHNCRTRHERSITRELLAGQHHAAALHFRDHGRDTLPGRHDQSLGRAVEQPVD